MHFRAVKDSVAQPLHRLGSLVARLPRPTGLLMAGCFGALAKAGYFLPGSHFRRTVGNFCRATGRTDPWPIYCRMVDNLGQAALHYAKLYHYGRSELLAHSVIDPTLQREYERLGGGDQGMILLVPHCAGAVLSSARLSTFCPTVLIVREPRDSARRELMLSYVRKLGPEFILVRNTPPATVMRKIIRALRENKVVVGTTDLVKHEPDTIQTRAFDQPIYSPAWPARLSARFGTPIIPGYIQMDGSQIRLIADEGYVEPDITESTQRWVSSFESRFRQYPFDWVSMLDKHWARVLAGASAATINPTTLFTSNVESFDLSSPRDG
jgi:lauroyl/myristoyl acyltransferase